MNVIEVEPNGRADDANPLTTWRAARSGEISDADDVDFYRFPGENHELSRAGSPVHRVQRAEIILDWFGEKLAPRG